MLDINKLIVHTYAEDFYDYEFNNSFYENYHEHNIINWFWGKQIKIKETYQIVHGRKIKTKNYITFYYICG